MGPRARSLALGSHSQAVNERVRIAFRRRSVWLRLVRLSVSIFRFVRSAFVSPPFPFPRIPPLAWLKNSGRVRARVCECVCSKKVILYSRMWSVCGVTKWRFNAGLHKSLTCVAKCKEQNNNSNSEKMTLCAHRVKEEPSVSFCVCCSF